MNKNIRLFLKKQKKKFTEIYGYSKRFIIEFNKYIHENPFSNIKFVHQFYPNIQKEILFFTFFIHISQYIC